MSTTGKKSAKEPRQLPHVEPIEGEKGRYWVQSSSRLNMRHLVDMLEYRGNGACGCEDFERRFRSHLEDGAMPSVRLACKHLRAVREYSAAVELWPAIAAHVEVRNRAVKQETKRRYADHEEMAEVEGTSQGTLDYPPERRAYELKSGHPRMEIQAKAVPDSAAVQGDVRENAGVHETR